MPATWTAQKSHGLTLPKRHALCRMGTRRRDRALFLVRTVRRVTLVVLTAWFCQVVDPTSQPMTYSPR
jgi:hypothetical protein